MCSLSIAELLSIKLATLCFVLADVSVLTLDAAVPDPNNDGFCINESLSDTDRKPGGYSKALFLFCGTLNEVESLSMVFDICVPGICALLLSLAGTLIENTLPLSTAADGMNVGNWTGGI